MIDMVERVAVAMYASRYKSLPWGEAGVWIQDEMRDFARVAIAAMREPTEDQLRAGEQDLRDQYDRSYWKDAKDVAETAEVRLVYWAMIDEALK